LQKRELRKTTNHQVTNHAFRGNGENQWLNAKIRCEPKYEVLWPLSRRAVRDTKAATRLPDLNGKVVAELWDVIFRERRSTRWCASTSRKRFPGVKFVGYEEFGNFHGAREHEVSATIPDKLKAHKADAVIVGIGA
jgi:hypothetical protein